MSVRIQVRRDSSENWQEANPVLASGEIGYITDLRMAKIGNGSDPFNTLQFLVGGNEAQILALINQNTAAITAESQARASGDAGLQSAINAESAARSEADNELSGRILALETADPEIPEIPEGLAEQVQTNTEAIQGLVTNDENLADAINGKLSLPQGELTELNVNDWLIIGRTDPNTGITPTYLSRLSTLKDELGHPEKPPATGFAKYVFAGETWWGQPAKGELWTNFGENQIYLSATDGEDKDQTENIRALRKGETLLVSGPEGWTRFGIKAKPSFASGENGDYYVINVRLEDLEGRINIGDEIVLSLAEDEGLANYIESVPAMDPLTDLYETVAKMRKELTALKGQVTRLKNGSSK